ncbi:hypothetical protein B566_EDAN016342 [Ephemera danica]|nr:hypothetical protein B566_EDAN016342 [Ephemera danica]
MCLGSNPKGNIALPSSIDTLSHTDSSYRNATAAAAADQVHERSFGSLQIPGVSPLLATSPGDGDFTLSPPLFPATLSRRPPVLLIESTNSGELTSDLLSMQCSGQIASCELVNAAPSQFFSRPGGDAILSAKMAAPLVLLLVSLLMACGECRPSLLNPNSVARPSVTYGRDHSPLEKDIAAIFNKVAHGSTAAPPNATTHIPTTTSPPPTTPPPPTTTTPNPATPLTPQPDTPEFVSRPRFKPPLPPEYTNPFADKAILRGSQSEGPAAGNNRRQLPAPPPPPIRPPPEVERIPIRPPDLLAPPVDRKKPLNTPAGGNGASSSIHRPENESNNKNETEENIPLLQSPAVTRILSENANRPDDNERRNNNSNSRVLLDLVNKDSMIDVQAPATLPSNIPSQDTPHVVTDAPRSYPVPEWPSHIGVINLHDHGHGGVVNSLHAFSNFAYAFY